MGQREYAGRVLDMQISPELFSSPEVNSWDVRTIVVTLDSSLGSKHAILIYIFFTIFSVWNIIVMRSICFCFVFVFLGPLLVFELRVHNMFGQPSS